MGSTNIEIENYIKNHYNGNFLGCFYANELPTSNLPFNCSLIANYSNRGEDGTHWVAMGNLNSNNGSESWYFDSFGKKPDSLDNVLDRKTYFLDYLKNHTNTNRFSNYNKENLQGQTADTCGHYATYAIIKNCCPYMKNPDPWAVFLNPLNTKQYNDNLIRKIIKL
jgi:hypothetical protein